VDRNLVTVSKFLAKHLRHAPDALGLTLQSGGWVSVDELLAASERIGFTITYDELIECVETNDKQRFSFDDTGDLIRANQGHSVEVDLQLEEKEPPIVLFHGTVERFLASIMTEGLKKGKRHHVHLSKDTENGSKGRCEAWQACHSPGGRREDARPRLQIFLVRQRCLADGFGACCFLNEDVNVDAFTDWLFAGIRGRMICLMIGTKLWSTYFLTNWYC